MGLGPNCKSGAGGRQIYSPVCHLYVIVAEQKNWACGNARC